MANKPVPGADGGVPTEEKVAFLSRPEAYAEAPAKVERKETHMSWVFLTDRHAYKMKKPVRYPFLDFSTVAARRRDCEREVRLNQRLAGDVYRGIVALVRREDGGLALGRGEDADSVVDWLVKMRRLPAERTLEHLIETGGVEETDLDRVSRRLGDFYDGLPPVDVAPDDYIRRFTDNIEINRRELSREEFGMPAGQVAAIAETQMRFLDSHAEVLAARAREGRIVEAHGDLRPEHIYLLPQPVIMDCLEFNQEFRMLDPVDELAYLAMECDRLGAPAIGPRMLAAYVEATGDEPPAPLVPFYKSGSAFLRAKIAIWHLDEPQARETTKWTRRTRQYLDLAEGYAGRFEAGAHAGGAV